MRRPLLKKALGQHHLVDGALCRPLLALPGSAGERVLEIGPGGGVLTAELLAAGARVLGWELDRRVGRRPAPPFPGPAPLALAVVGDALGIAWDRLPRPPVVAGNLPYNVATAILEDLLPHHARIPRAAFLVQKEVADRLVARPGDGGLRLLQRDRGRRRPGPILGRVRPGSFRPPPEGRQRLRRPRAPLPAAAAGGDGRPSSRFVRLAFASGARRCATRWPQGGGGRRRKRRWRAAGIPERARAEELGLAEFLGIWGRRGAGL